MSKKSCPTMITWQNFLNTIIPDQKAQILIRKLICRSLGDVSLHHEFTGNEPLSDTGKLSA